MKRFKSILIYFLFPVLLIVLTFMGLNLVLIPVIITYFVLFTIFQYENILKIFSGYHSKRGEINKSLRYIYRAYKLKKSSIHTSLILVYMLLKAGKYDQAGEIINITEKREMTNYELHQFKSNKALYLWKKNRIQDSLSLYEELMTDGESTVLYGSYGYVLTLGGNLEKALEVNEAAYQYNHDDKAIMDNLGLTYIKTGDKDKAFDIYKKLLAKMPKFPEAYYNAAELMRLMHDYDTGLKYIKKCMTLPFNGLSTITVKEAEKKLDQLNRLHGSVK